MNIFTAISVIRNRSRMYPLAVIRRNCCLVLLICLFSACDREVKTSVVSVAPKSRADNERVQLAAQPSQLGLIANVAYADLASLVSQQFPATYTGTGDERKCKKVIGIKVCGTADWRFTVKRGDNIDVSGVDDQLVVSLPISFSGTAGLKGDVAKALGLSNLDFSGAMQATTKLGLRIDNKWCPELTAEVVYQWLQSPKVSWVGGLDVNIKKYLDDEIHKQLKDLPKKLNDSIDCEQFRSELAQHWRNYSIPIAMTDQQQLYLNLTPTGFGFSGIKTEAAHFAVAFALQTNAIAESEPLQDVNLPLPELRMIELDSGSTRFELLVRVNYNQLQSLVEAELNGKTFSGNTAIGTTDVTITSTRIYSSEQGMTIELAFDAALPATRSNTPGIVYLTAQPVVDTLEQKIRLDDISLTQVLDNTLWNSLASVFEGKIIDGIEKNAVVDLQPRIDQLQTDLALQLSNPHNTKGIQVRTNDLTIRIKDIQSESDAVVAILTLDTELELDVPITPLASSNGQ